MNDVIVRIKELMKYSELNISQTAQKVGISQPNLSSLLSGRRVIGENTINRFVMAFDINKKWLKYGTGEMFIKNKPKMGKRGKETVESLVKKAICDCIDFSRIDGKKIFFTYSPHVENVEFYAHEDFPRKLNREIDISFYIRGDLAITVEDAKRLLKPLYDYIEGHRIDK